MGCSAFCFLCSRLVNVALQSEITLLMIREKLGFPKQREMTIHLGVIAGYVELGNFTF